MREPVTVEENAFRKGRAVFASEEPTISWLPAPGDEQSMAEATRRSGARVVVLGATQYRGALYDALAANGGGRATLIARFGVGYDGIDAEACRRRGILVTNTPGALDESVAEHAVALLLALARRVPGHDGSTRSGEWKPMTTFELRGQTLGIAGFGRIGKRTAAIAARGFGMRIHAFDTLSIEEQASSGKTSVDELKARHSIEGYHTDFAAFARSTRLISIHLPVTPETRAFFSRERLGMLREGTLLVNTGRGALIDENALYDELRAGRLGGAALDVFAREPYVAADAGRDLRTLPNVICTPHVASDTEEANANMANGVMANVRAFLRGSLDSLTRVI